MSNEGSHIDVSEVEGESDENDESGSKSEGGEVVKWKDHTYISFI